MKRRRTWLWILAVVLVIAVAAHFGARGLAERARRAAAQVQTGETVTLTLGDLAASATASGQVTARRQANLAPAASGRVAHVFVEPGDVVAAGDALVQLQTEGLERAVATAEQTVAIQQATLEQLRAGPDAAELAAAQAALNSAQTQLDELLDGPAAQEIAAAEANLRAAQANVARASSQLGETQTPANESAILQAQINLEDAEEAVLAAERSHQQLMDCEQQDDGEWICTPRDLPFMSEEEEAELVRQAELQVIQAREMRNAAQAELERLQQGADENTVGASQANLAQAAAQRDAAQANLDLLLAGPTEAEIAAARSNLAEAQANLARLEAGATAADLARAETQLAQAEIALQQARSNLEKATLRAPFAGIVADVYVSEGELAGGPAVALLDTGSLEVVLDVDEIDVGDLAVGQEALVTLQPWPDEAIATEIVSISPAASTLALSGGISTFRVRLALPPTDLPIREGMTADASLQTAHREDVLLAPNRAIIVDRESGSYYVTLVESGPDGVETTRRVEVTIGLRDDRYTEITSGLVEGDRVRIGPVVQPLDLFQPGGPQGGGPFGED